MKWNKKDLEVDKLLQMLVLSQSFFFKDTFGVGVVYGTIIFGMFDYNYFARKKIFFYFNPCSGI